MIAAVARHVWTRRRLGHLVNQKQDSPWRRCMTSTNGTSVGDKDKKDPGEEDEEVDEFAMEGFEIEDDAEEEDLDAALQNLSDNPEEVTPELASDLVARMIEATTRRIDRRSTGSNIIPFISPHTVSVLRASRITTNAIQAAASDEYPHAIEKKVTAELDIDQLNLSKPARAAIEFLSGPRLRDHRVKISCNQYPSLQENRAHIVSQIDRLVSAAKVSVGEDVDLVPLESWEQVVREVEKQAQEEIQEAGGVSLLLGETKA